MHLYKPLYRALTRARNHEHAHESLATHATDSPTPAPALSCPAPPHPSASPKPLPCEQSVAPQLFAASLFPYIAFLYYLTRSGKAPKLTLGGFYFLLVFVGATIPAGIYGALLHRMGPAVAGINA